MKITLKIGVKTPSSKCELDIPNYVFGQYWKKKKV